jgi:hypothetical protein
MTSTDEWITGATAVAMLRDAGVVDLRVLGVWARDGLLGARAKVERVAGTIETYKPTPAAIPGDFWDELSAKSVMGDGGASTIETDAPTSRAISSYFWGELRANTVMADWAAGVFETTTDIDTEEEGWREVSWRISGVEFNANELEALLCSKSAFSSTSTESQDSNSQRGKLPASAKPNDRKYEESAHAAAKAMREKKVKKSEAFRDEATSYSGVPETVQRAIRQAYDSMYDENGNPHQIDPN